MHHLNYCRQFAKQCRTLLDVPSVPHDARSLAAHAVDLCRLSTKFLLPPGGYLLDDQDLRALDDLPLSLPYPCIALEFELPDLAGQRRNIVFVRHDEDKLLIRSAAYLEHNGNWWFGSFDVALPLVNWSLRKDGGFTLMWREEDAAKVDESHRKGAHVVLGFLNALACSNVRAERSNPPKLKAMMGKGLPYDSYHLLTIEGGDRGPEDGNSQHGSHRSPREHLRRGHIRRLQDGRKLWINATVVNPGVGGKVTKDYRLTA